jgi:hypothetical protein
MAGAAAPIPRRSRPVRTAAVAAAGALALLLIVIIDGLSNRFSAVEPEPSLPSADAIADIPADYLTPDFQAPSVTTWIGRRDCARSIRLL